MTTAQFNDFYKMNIVALENFAKKLTRDQIEAQDLVQETAIKAFRGMHTFKEGTSFKSWSFTILKNTFITKYNKRKKRNIVNAPIEDFTYALSSMHAVRNDAISQLKIKEIKGCIKQLSPKSKKPFLMHVEGYQYNEIADTLNIPIGTVKSRINYARTKLKGIMEVQGFSMVA
ncbi:MAG: RNA polymerase sigma factor (sigma-70 family) [Saprospiraceae bacterium]|jgi:RNA polymerase sigma factor (sigma-70 family)|tara:strand:+ start:485 stop:1003 length:519 start_codon:yes stop_codon:yes gene_type:complete